MGFGLGGSHISVTLTMEVTPPAMRNTVLNLLQVIVNIIRVSGINKKLVFYSFGHLDRSRFSLGIFRIARLEKASFVDFCS